MLTERIYPRYVEETFHDISMYLRSLLRRRGVESPRVPESEAVVIVNIILDDLDFHRVSQDKSADEVTLAEVFKDFNGAVVSDHAMQIHQRKMKGEF